VAAPEGVQAFVAHDLDGDGELDLAMWGYSLFPPADYAIAWGSSAGFSAPSWTELEVVGDFVAVGELDGAEGLDLLVAGPRSGGTNNEVGALVLSGDGARTFSPGGYTVRGVASAVGDFDGDGIADLFTAHTDTFGIGKGVGDGTFEAFVEKYPVPTYLYSNGGNGTFVGIGDYDENGTLDAVVPLYSMGGIGELELLLVDEMGVFSVGDRKTVSVGRPIVADFDGDDHLDVAGTSAANDEVRVWLGDGAGLLEPVTGLIPATGDAPNSGASGDLDGDGFADIAVYNYDSGDMSVLFGNGDGTFQAERRIEPRLAGAFDLRVANVDGDGFDDVIYATLDGVDVYYGPCP
jgi:hypothetical protein